MLFHQADHHRMRLRAGWLALLAAVAGSARWVSAEGVVIFTEDKLPRWGQRHDFRNVYDGLATDIRNQANTAWVAYNQLAADPRVAYHHNAANIPTGLLSANPTAMNTPFVANHYYRAGPPPAGLAGGSFHCAPAASAIWADWARQTKLTRLNNLGAEKAAIEYFAEAMDTNDQNQVLNINDNVVHSGTYRRDNFTAINNYIQGSSIWY